LSAELALGGVALATVLVLLWAVVRLGQRAGRSEAALDESARRLAEAERRLGLLSEAPPNDAELLAAWRLRVRDRLER